MCNGTKLHLELRWMGDVSEETEGFASPSYVKYAQYVLTWISISDWYHMGGWL